MHHAHIRRRGVILLISILLSAPCAFAQEDALVRAFRAPPEEAKPWVMWQWMNGCVSKEGITADLEAMKRVGIGGMFLYHVDQLPIDDPSFAILNPSS